MVFKVLFWIALGLECVSVPIFIKLQWPNKNKLSLLAKMVCSFLFVAVALLSMKIADNYSIYAKLVLLALISSFFGDFFLHVKETLLFRFIGMLFFMGCHAFLIAAVVKSWPLLFPSMDMIRTSGLFLIELLIVVVFVYGLIRKWSVLKTLIPFSIYTAFLATMFAAVGNLGIVFAKTDGPNAFLLATLLFVGALCFLLSDLSLGLIYTSKKCRKNLPFKIFNTVTYFGAQIMIACTILYLNP